jgi:hypothetical protein
MSIRLVKFGNYKWKFQEIPAVLDIAAGRGNSRSTWFDFGWKCLR